MSEFVVYATPLTEEQCNQLAIEILGWKTGDATRSRSWAPDKDLDQALMIAHNLPAWSLDYYIFNREYLNLNNDKKYYRLMFIGSCFGEMIKGEITNSPALTICTAALKWIEAKKKFAADNTDNTQYRQYMLKAEIK